MNNTQEQTDSSLQWYYEQTVPTQPDQIWDPLPPSNTGDIPNPQDQTYESLQGYPGQTVWTQQGQPSDSSAPSGAEASSNLRTHDAWTSAVWGIHRQHLPGAQSAFEQHPDQRSFGTSYPSNDANQVEYHANTFQTGSVATGFNPAQSMDYGSGPDYDPALSPPNESSYTRPVGAESHRIAAHRAELSSNLHNAKRYKVWRKDNAPFCNESGESVDSMEVPTQKRLAAYFQCDPDTIRRALIGKQGEPAIIQNEWLVLQI